MDRCSCRLVDHNRTLCGPGSSCHFNCGAVAMMKCVIASHIRVTLHLQVPLTLLPFFVKLRAEDFQPNAADMAAFLAEAAAQVSAIVLRRSM